MTDPAARESGVGFTLSEGYAASLRQQATWIDESREGTVPVYQRIDIGDIDTDELRAAADHIEALTAALSTAEGSGAVAPLTKFSFDDTSVGRMKPDGRSMLTHDLYRTADFSSNTNWYKHAASIIGLLNSIDRHQIRASPSPSASEGE